MLNVSANCHCGFGVSLLSWPGRPSSWIISAVSLIAHLLCRKEPFLLQRVLRKRSHSCEGSSIPTVAVCYWVGEAMGSTDFKDLKEMPEMVAKTADMVAGNAAHLADLRRSSPYPG